MTFLEYNCFKQNHAHKKHKITCDIDLRPMTLIVHVRAAVHEASCSQSFDDAENNTAVASAGSKKKNNEKRNEKNEKNSTNACFVRRVSLLTLRRRKNIVHCDVKSSS